MFMAEIKMYTTTRCSDCRHAKRFLNERGISYEEINIEEQEGAAEYVMQVNGGKRRRKLVRRARFDFDKTQNIFIQNNQINLARDGNAAPISANRNFEIRANQSKTAPQ